VRIVRGVLSATLMVGKKGYEMEGKLIGHCAVDSGQILLIDPCYVYNDNFKGLDSDPTGGDYDECCRITLRDGAGQTSNLGVVTSTAWGDGSYPVYADMSGGRVMSVTIVFDQDDEDEDEDDEDDEDEDEDDE
jgi:hypothetical protein